MKLLLIISLLIQSAFGLNVKTLSGIEKYTGTATQIFVTGFKEEGLFYPCTTFYPTVDGGILIKDARGRIWQRWYDYAEGVNVLWWKAKGDGKTNDIAAFNAMSKFCHVTRFGEGDIREVSFGPVMNIPDGLYSIEQPWNIGGKPLNGFDARWYQWYYNWAPSYQLSEHIIIAGYLPVSIKCGKRAYILGNFKPDTLTAVVSIGSAGWGYGGYDMQTSDIEGLKIAGYNGLDMYKRGDTTKQIGLLTFGGNGVTFKGCGFYGLQDGMVQNCSYFNTLIQMNFRNCGRGYLNIGGHATTGLMWQADHCGVGFEIKAGASAYTQISTEQCQVGLIVGGGFNSFNGLYLEQLAGNSDSTQYQLQIGYNDGSFPVMGTTVTGMTIAGPNGILMNETARGLEVRGSNFVSSGVKTTSKKNTIALFNCFSDIQGNQPGRIIPDPMGNYE